MKKLLAILVLCMFFIISFANNDYSEAAKCKKNQILKNGKCEFDMAKFIKENEKKSKRIKFFKKITGISYFEKRKKCKEWADRASTVYMGKKRYKSCMEEG